MQGGLVKRKLPVRPSVCQTRGLCQNGRKICSDFYTIPKDHLSSFLGRMVDGGQANLPELLVKLTTLEQKR